MLWRDEDGGREATTSVRTESRIVGTVKITGIELQDVGAWDAVGFRASRGGICMRPTTWCELGWGGYIPRSSKRPTSCGRTRSYPRQASAN